jgi:abortive infection bacteriophage resistance protein
MEVSMPEKIYKSYRQQLSILRSRGMDIGKGSQGSRVIKILERENYYNVINGYKELFLASHATATADEIYKTGTTFDEVYALYTFDRELRDIYLKNMLKLENTFKTVISHEFSKRYGHDNYLKIENFDNSSEKSITNSIKLVGDIQQEIARQMSKHHQSITHYMTAHGYIPLWVLVNVLTFGKIENFYKCMKPADRVAVSKQFGLQPDELTKYMHMLALARNKCAHDERFFDMKFKERLHTKSIKNFSVLKIVRASDGSYTYGTNDVYAIAIMFALLLSKTETKEFVSSMKSVFNKLNKQLHTISAMDVMRCMGFGPTWDQISKLR